MLDYAAKLTRILQDISCSVYTDTLRRHGYVYRI